MTKEELRKYKFVVIVTCQGQPSYYFHKHLIPALFMYMKKYRKHAKYNTMNFVLEDAFLVSPEKIAECNIKRR